MSEPESVACALRFLREKSLWALSLLINTPPMSTVGTGLLSVLCLS